MNFQIENSTLKLFQPLKDLSKYMAIVNTNERILYECPVFLKAGGADSNSKIKFLRLYETFILISTVLDFYYYYYSSL